VNGLQPWLRPYAAWLLGNFPSLKVTSVFRSLTDQMRLYRNRARNPYPVLPPGYSKHQYGLAWDMTGDRSLLEQAGRMWRRMGGRWGGATDPIHFEV